MIKDIVVNLGLNERDPAGDFAISMAETFEAHVKMLEQFHRPLICTEYMARNIGSTFDTILPIAKREHVGAINWGLVKGKMQT